MKSSNSPSLLDFPQALLIGLIRLSPYWLTSSLNAFFSNTAFLFYRSRRKTTLQNIETAFSDSLTHQQKKSLARKAFQHIGLSFLDIFLTKKVSANFKDHIEFEGMHHFDEAQKTGKGTIFVVSHVGSWEYLAFVNRLFKDRMKLSVIVKEIHNPYLNKVVNQMRHEIGIRPISKDDNPIKKSLQDLKQNNVVSILIDQWAGNDGIWIDFFGKKTSTTSIPARLAKRTGAALIPGFCIRTGPQRFKIIIQAPIPFPQNDKEWEKNLTLKFNHNLEDFLRQYPEQWIWGHKRWKDRPEKLREI